jgi:hypothetical protein
MCSRFLEPPPAEFRPYPVILTSERQGSCLHLGAQVGHRECPSCQGNVKLKVFECSHPGHGETTMRDCEQCVDYERPLAKRATLTWSIGVLLGAADDKFVGELQYTLHGLGWANFRLFVDGPATGGMNCAMTGRDAQIGRFPHWYLSLAELYLRSPRCDAFLLLAGNASLPAIESLETLLWPEPNTCFVGLAAGASSIDGRAALCTVRDLTDLEFVQGWCFPNFAIRSLLSSRHMVSHRLRGQDAGLGMIHLALHDWIRETQCPAFLTNVAAMSPATTTHSTQEPTN